MPGQTTPVAIAGPSHLRSGDQPEWDEFAGKLPNARRLDLRFRAQPAEGEVTLLLSQDNVKQPWTVELNGQKLGQLFLMEAPLVQAIPFPGRLLREGDNLLSIIPPRENDDIIISNIKLARQPLKTLLNQAKLDIEVKDENGGRGIPCRITILDEQRALAALQAADDTQKLAVRPGVVYTGNGSARLGLLPGTYTVYATRGFEYGLGSQTISVRSGETQHVRLTIRREVSTPGLVSSDTHVHTFTYSRHGDATVEERALTLAGEGIELPIATDHEYLADLSDPAKKMGVEKYFTPVIGCETTTAKGHFNSFPIQAGSRVPDFRITDWPQLLQSIRATPGVRVVILNHPRNIHVGFQPFAATNFNAVTGENRRGFEFNFDAIEVANSSALQSDWMLNFRDWFALLNYGYRVTAVGSSDGHDVSRYIIGQGRSYVSCRDDDPSKLDIDAACDSFLKGRVLVSLGLLTKIAVNEKFLTGELATASESEIRVDISVLGPSWITADRVELYANGVKIREMPINDSHPINGSKAMVTWRIPRPKHDLHLIALATGPGVREQYWAIARPYQPSSPSWQPRVVGATNPVWVDADGDGKFTAARSYARSILERSGRDVAKVLAALAEFDEPTSAHAATLLQQSGVDLRDPATAREFNSAPAFVKQGFQAALGAPAHP